jgi:hypothetical protein
LTNRRINSDRHIQALLLTTEKVIAVQRCDLTPFSLGETEDKA